MKKFLAMVCMITMIGTLAACGKSTESTNEPAADPAGSEPVEAAEPENGDNSDVIRFAVCGPMTGDTAEQGMNQVNGCQMAVDEINAAGGVNGKKLELVAFDDQASPNQAVIVAEKIAADPTIEFVIAHINSGCTIAAQDIYIDAGLAVLAPVNSLDELSDFGWDNYMRICLSDGSAAKVLVDTIMEKEEVQKPAIFYANTANDLSACNIYKSHLEEKYGFTDIPAETFNPETDKDFSSQIEKFKAAGVDAIFLACEYTPSALLATQSHEKGFNPVIGGLACNNPEILSLGGEDVEGVYTVTGFDVTDPDEGVQELIAKYKEAYNKEPNDCVTRGYDTVYCVAEAYENGATSENLAEWMLQNTDYHGVTCDIRFDGKCDNQSAATYILQIESGKYNFVAKGTLN